MKIIYFFTRRILWRPPQSGFGFLFIREVEWLDRMRKRPFCDWSARCSKRQKRVRTNATSKWKEAEHAMVNLHVPFQNVLGSKVRTFMVKFQVHKYSKIRFKIRECEHFIWTVCWSCTFPIVRVLSMCPSDASVQFLQLEAKLPPPRRRHTKVQLGATNILRPHWAWLNVDIGVEAEVFRLIPHQNWLSRKMKNKLKFSMAETSVPWIPQYCK